MTGVQGGPVSRQFVSWSARGARRVKAGFGARGSLVLAALTCAAGCASLAPVAVKLGADLISAAANNYSKTYSREVENLLLALYTENVAKMQSGQVASGAGAAAYSPAGSEPYPSQSTTAAGPIVFDVAILAQRASERAARRTQPVPIQDGEVLRDGGSDPRKGDVVKFSFRANCDCYVYVIGVDATAYVARVFPEKGRSRVRANQQYIVPQGTAWYGLDEYKGIEQVFFLASRQPRPDIDKLLGQLAKTGRSSLSRNYRPVREAAVPDAATRGLVKVQMGTKSTVRSEAGQSYAFTPQAFAARQGADDVVVTRWFRHE
jgi:hypothetical protein